MHDGWTSLHERLPHDDEYNNDQVIVWHAIQGPVVVKRDRLCSTAMYTHWMCIPDSGWRFLGFCIPPLQKDADAQNCVLVMEEFDHYRVTGWHQVQNSRVIQAWQPTPAPPANYKDLRKLF